MSSNYLEPPIVVATYKLYQSFAPLCVRFPKIYRYSIGQTIEQEIMSLLRTVFEANSLPRPLREMPVIRANSHCELLKLLIRLALELDLLNHTQYFQFSTHLQEMGKMLGGWINYQRTGKSNAND